MQEARMIEKVKSIKREIEQYLLTLKESGRDIGMEDDDQLKTKQRIEEKLQVLDKNAISS